MLRILLICLLPAFAQSQITPAARKKAHAQLLADSLFFKKEWKKARDQYQLCLNDSPGNNLAWLRMGYCNQNTGYFVEAIRDYEMSMMKNPTPALKAAAESRMARVYSMQNKNDLAMTHLDSAIESGYSNLEELDSLTDYDHIRKDPKFILLYQKAYVKAFPCLADPKAREFDFWVGEWDVYSAGNNNLVGKSVIEKISGGCAILENYHSMQTSYNGKSINNYDGSKGNWEQMWVGSSGVELPGPDVQRFVNGQYKDGAMRFTFETIQQGQKAIGNFIFFNLGHDKVRQYQETSTDGGKTFQVVYDLIYLRKK